MTTETISEKPEDVILHKMILELLFSGKEAMNTFFDGNLDNKSHLVFSPLLFKKYYAKREYIARSLVFLCFPILLSLGCVILHFLKMPLAPYIICIIALSVYYFILSTIKIRKKVNKCAETIVLLDDDTKSVIVALASTGNVEIYRIYDFNYRCQSKEIIVYPRKYVRTCIDISDNKVSNENILVYHQNDDKKVVTSISIPRAYDVYVPDDLEHKNGGENDCE